MATPQLQPVIESRDASLMILGGLRAMDRLSKVVDGEVMRTMIAFRDEKKFLELGYTQFVDFLKSPHAPMTKNEFYTREEIFSNEGEHLFDLLNSMNVPISLRKRLGAGNVTVEGEKVILREGENETAIELSNRTGLLEALASLADANAEKSKKIEKGQNDYRKLKEKLLDAEESSGERVSLPALEKAHTVAIGGLAALAGELEKASIVDCSGYTDGQFSLLVSQINRINQLLCEKLGVESLSIGDDDEKLAALLDD